MEASLGTTPLIWIAGAFNDYRQPHSRGDGRDRDYPPESREPQIERIPKLDILPISASGASIPIITSLIGIIEVLPIGVEGIPKLRVLLNPTDGASISATTSSLGFTSDHRGC
ncbi:hypothetical protein CRG98_035095 [Punica granatum]|uniref:Uncharacterized protein n=1 Tax=Punica granatum TaxID=22663 RepID=A0A2I0IKI2_PUNGR|nr:hypothetical protein CRG98_035095 [Punica granatum]